MNNIFKISIAQISLAAMLVALGVVSDVYIRIGHTTFITTSIFILLGLLVPISLGITSALLIDTLQLVFRGLIGYWYWSLQLEPVAIVLISYLFRLSFSKIKEKKQMFILSTFLLIGMIIAGVTISAIEHEQFNLSKTNETDSQYTTRLITKYMSLFGFILVILLFIYFLYNFHKGKSTDIKIVSLIIVIAVSIIIDWIYHPWATYNWRVHKLGMDHSIEIFRLGVVSGIWKSLFHIGIGIPAISGIYLASKGISESHKNKY